MKVFKFFWLIFLAFVNLSYSSYSIRSDELQRKLENQRFLEDKETSEDLKKEFLLNLMLDDFLEKALEPKIEEENEALKNDLDLTSMEELEALERAIAEEDGKWLDETEDIEDDFPDNYHNSTEVLENIDGSDVDFKQTIDKSTNGNSKSAVFRETIEARSDESDETDLFACSLIQPCPKTQYCLETEYTSVCLTCQALGSGCVDDAQCCSADDSTLPLCVSGVCRSGVEIGSEGTICDTTDDCSAGYCCAEVLDFPRRLCRRFSRLEERCSPLSPAELDTGLSGQLNYFCPCQNGLSCTSRAIFPNNRDLLDLLQNHFCAMPKTKNTAEIDRLQGYRNGYSKAPVSDEKIANLFARLWQARAETEEDQRFNPPSQVLHHGIKESTDYNSKNNPSM